MPTFSPGHHHLAIVGTYTATLITGDSALLRLPIRFPSVCGCWLSLPFSPLSSPTSLNQPVQVCTCHFILYVHFDFSLSLFPCYSTSLDLPRPCLSRPSFPHPFDLTLTATAAARPSLPSFPSRPFLSLAAPIFIPVLYSVFPLNQHFFFIWGF